MDIDDIFKKLSAGAVFKKRPPKSSKPTLPPGAASVSKPDCQAKIEDGSSTSNSQEKNTSTKKTKLIETERINHLRNKHHINVTGDHVPRLIENFSQLHSEFQVPQRIIDNVLNCGYTSPTPIQMQAIPAMLKGKQILACAPTGSGKTAAFLIPIIHQLGKPKNVGYRAVIVSPTRELSRQTYREALRLSEGLGLRIHITTKIKEIVKKQNVDASNKYDLLITTPNRLVFLLNQETTVISLKSVEWLIVDESDKLFETGVRGFRDQLAVIYQACDSANVKRAMFSATYTVEVAKWCRKNLKNFIMISVGHRNTTVKSIEQELIYVGNEEGKLIAMRDLIRKGISPPVLIFLQSKERARELFHELLYDGINVDVIHADRTQLQRDNVVRAFREGKIWVLICTELMGRGIDFKGVNLVINYDFPPSAISYIHRIGRTGRAGRPGKALTFFCDDDTPYLKSIVNVMKESGCEVPDFMLSIKKPHKKILRKLESHVPSREKISKKPHRYKLVDANKEKKMKTNSSDENSAVKKPKLAVKRKSTADSSTSPSKSKRSKKSDIKKTDSSKKRKSPTKSKLPGKRKMYKKSE